MVRISSKSLEAMDLKIDGFVGDFNVITIPPLSDAEYDKLENAFKKIYQKVYEDGDPLCRPPFGDKFGSQVIIGKIPSNKGVQERVTKNGSILYSISVILHERKEKIDSMGNPIHKVSEKTGKLLKEIEMTAKWANFLIDPEVEPVQPFQSANGYCVLIVGTLVEKPNPKGGHFLNITKYRGCILVPLSGSEAEEENTMVDLEDEIVL